MNFPTHVRVKFSSKKLKRYLLLALILILILREIFPINIPLYKFYPAWSVSTYINFDKTSHKQDSVFNEFDGINFDKSEDYHVEVRGLYEREEKSKGLENTIKVSVIKDLDMGIARFIPLIKPLNFTSHNSFNWIAKIFKQGEMYEIKGFEDVNITGSIKIYGICSGREAKIRVDEIITSEIDKILFTQVEEQMNAIKNEE